MKPSTTYLGNAIQLFLLQHGMQLDDLAAEINITPDALSNLIHGRRRFRDCLLESISSVPVFQQHYFTQNRLKALRAMDEYLGQELLLACVEHVKRGNMDNFSPELIDELERHLEQFPQRLGRERQLLSDLFLHSSAKEEREFGLAQRDMQHEQSSAGPVPPLPSDRFQGTPFSL